MKKSYYILIVVLVFAAAVWFLERPDKGSRGDFESFLLFPNVKTEDVVRIETEYLADGAIIERDDEGWKVSPLVTKIREQMEGDPLSEEDKKYKADEDKVDSAVDLLKKLKAVSLMSTNPGRQTTYQVNQLGKQVRLIDKAGNTVADLFIGKDAPEVATVYVRKGGDNNVYQAVGQLNAVIPADLMSWRDKKIWEIDPGLISGVGISRGGNSYKILKDGSGNWNLIDPRKQKLDAGKVGKVISDIAKVSAVRFAYVDENLVKGFESPNVVVTLTAAGQVYRLIVGENSSQGYLYAKLDGNDEIYLLESNFDKKLPEKWEVFIQENPDKTQ